MKKLVKVFAFLLACMVLLTACKKEQETVEKEPQSEVEQEETYNFAFCCLTLDNPFFISLESSIREAVEAEGHTLITLDAKSDQELQNEQIAELVEQDIDAVFLSPVDWIEITPAIEMLKEAGIKIINVDTQVQSFNDVDAYVGSDNSNAGYLCGKDMIEKLPDGGKIIIVECPNRNSINERIKGFEKAIAGEGFEVVARIDAKGDLDVALPEVEEVLKNEPDVVAIMCGNDPTALGALVAANSAGAKDVLIYGIDGSPEVKKELVKENTPIVATVGQSTIKMGQEAAAVAIKIMQGEDYERVIYIETFLINKENVNTYGVDTWQ